MSFVARMGTDSVFLSGELKIAEVTSRFLNLEDFVSLVSSIGFKLKSKVSYGFESDLW